MADERGEGINMNFKKYINQIYEFRLIQSSKALISFYKEIQTFFPNDIIMDFDKDNKIIEKLYHKLIIKRRKLTDKEIDRLLAIYLFYSCLANQIYQLQETCSNIERYSIYLMVASCIYKYYQIEATICEIFNISKDIIIENIINGCLIIRNLLMELINYDLVTNKKLCFEKNKIPPLSKRFQNITKEDIKLIEEDIKMFIDNYWKEVLYPVKFEFDRQISDVQERNKKFFTECCCI